MPWFGWAVLADLAFSLLVKVSQVGKDREPVSSAEAVCGVIEVALVMWAVAALGVR